MDDKKKIEEALSESEIQEKKLRAAKAARKRKKRKTNRRLREVLRSLYRLRMREKTKKSHLA